MARGHSINSLALLTWPLYCNTIWNLQVSGIFFTYQCDKGGLGTNLCGLGFYLPTDMNSFVKKTNSTAALGKIAFAFLLHFYNNIDSV